MNNHQIKNTPTAKEISFNQLYKEIIFIAELVNACDGEGKITCTKKELIDQVYNNISEDSMSLNYRRTDISRKLQKLENEKIIKRWQRLGEHHDMNKAQQVAAQANISRMRYGNQKRQRMGRDFYYIITDWKTVRAYLKQVPDSLRQTNELLNKIKKIKARLLRNMGSERILTAKNSN